MTSAYADFIDELQPDVTLPIQPPMDDLAPGTRAVIYPRVSSTGQVRKKVSENKISQMLRDRYYLGYVEYDGEEIQGRREPLIDEDLFDTVQEILESRTTAQERRRVHHHYLKGSLFCGRCQRDGTKRRMIIQRTINSKGAEYLYFFCRGRQKEACQAPYVNVTLVEDAVERRYAAIRFSQPFIADMRDQIDAVLGEQEKSARLLRRQITAQLKELDTKEENLIDLAADSALPQTKVKEKLRDIAHERRRLEEHLDTANADLTNSAQLVNSRLALLEQPDQLYRRCNDHQHRLLNQAIFQALYIEHDKTTDGELHEPSANSTPSKICGPQQRARVAQTKGPPTVRVVLARRQASRSYFMAIIQALVLLRTLGWS
ncbi:hypothetical protein GCM10027445_12430 [Amycolatopsis endophytica]|uniref:Recombinase domain-containing protein n=1 Tax=Amycolatopsis endophytica TaxID=860233 RepID=A0A853B306_9PSEU|nr:recombinase family protein [Amycolatopsis endophytica]NYI89380.1 hypothetical protein [Amycolatopsis endophytica]